MTLNFEEWLRTEITRENERLDTLKPYSPDYIAHAYRLNGLEECLRQFMRFSPSANPDDVSPAGYRRRRLLY